MSTRRSFLKRFGAAAAAAAAAAATRGSAQARAVPEIPVLDVEPESESESESESEPELKSVRVEPSPAPVLDPPAVPVETFEFAHGLPSTPCTLYSIAAGPVLRPVHGEPGTLIDDTGHRYRMTRPRDGVFDDDYDAWARRETAYRQTRGLSCGRPETPWCPCSTCKAARNDR